MKRLKATSFAILALLVAGCSSTSIYVPVTMPMEIDLRGVNTIGIALYRSGEETLWNVYVSPGRLTETFLNSFSTDTRFAAFNLYDYESELNMPVNNNAITERTVTSFAATTGAEAFIFGEVLSLEYDEDIITAEVRRFQKKDGQQVVRKGLLRLKMHLRVVDARSQEMIWNDIVEHSIKAESSAADKEPELIDPVPLAYRAAEQAAREMLELTEQATESVLATFLTDSDYPAVDRAIRKAQAGDWHEALKIFETVAERAEGKDDEHRMLYNLGVAYQFNYNFRKALAAFERAYELEDSQRYKIAIDECLKMEEMYRATVDQQ